jgi:chorismate mutase
MSDTLTLLREEIDLRAHQLLAMEGEHRHLAQAMAQLRAQIAQMTSRCVELWRKEQQHV